MSSTAQLMSSESEKRTVGRFLTPAELIITFLAAGAWIVFLFFVLTPPYASTDVYCFRDPTINLLRGEGFRTASYVLSNSFRPVVYSINTPLSNVAYLPFAWIFGPSSNSAQIYYLVLALCADFACILLVAKSLPPGRLRLVLIVLIALLLPVGLVAAQLDRPENLSFLLLLVLVLLIRRVSSGRVLCAGVISGLCFLSEPFAGVVGMFLIAGAVWHAARNNRQDHLRRMVTAAALAAAGFFLPICITAAILYHQDPESISRFLHHSSYVANRGTGEDPDALPANSTPAHQSFPQKMLKRYVSAARFYISMGPSILLLIGAFLLIGLWWFLYCFQPTADRSARISFCLLGLILLAFPVVVFPMQGNYFLLCRCLFPFVLALDWAGAARFGQSRKWVAPILVLNLVVLFPGLILGLAQRTEGKASYLEAAKQVTVLRSYLNAHRYTTGEVLVPSTEYYLYKPTIDGIFNPEYLSPNHDPKQVVAIVNCNTGTHYFQPLQKPLPSIADRQNYQLISTGEQQVHVRILGHNIASRNWTWACDIYARP